MNAEAKLERLDPLMDSLVPQIEHAIAKVTECGHMHFSIVVWCECQDTPLYCGANDDNRTRVIKMLRGACDGLLAGMEVEEGHA